MSNTGPKLTTNSPDPAGALTLRAIRVEGRDAFAFLQAQLTADLSAAPARQLAPAAWCDANGRVAIFCLVSCDEHGAWLVTPIDRVAETLRRIRMYGIGRDVRARDAGAVQPVDPATSGALPLAGAPERALTPIETAPDEASAALPDFWLTEDLSRRVPWITDATSGRFLPQMIGVDALGGLSYRKGCYPGQEVIARVHYRGRVTREARLMHARTTTRPRPGDSLTPDRGDPRVLYAAPAGQDGYLFLAVTPVEGDDDAPIAYRIADSECIPLDNPG